MTTKHLLVTTKHLLQASVQGHPDCFAFNFNRLAVHIARLRANAIRIAGLTWLCSSLGLSTPVQAQAASVQEMQELVQRWVVLEQQNTAISTNWQREEQILRQRLQLLAEEKNQLSEIIANNSFDTDAVTERRTNLLELQNTMESDQNEMQLTLSTAMGAINSLHSQLPPPLITAWQERLDLLAAETSNDQTANSNIQLQALLEMLNQLQDFQQRISLNESTITFANGSEILVKQVYLGLSHAWYVSADGEIAGYGQSQTEGWTWLSEPQVDPTVVQQAIAMLERNVDVQMVELPLILQEPPAIYQQTATLGAQ